MKTPNRYLIFGGQQFYASGGANDLLLTANTEKKAIKLADKIVGKEFAIDADEYDDDPEWGLTDIIEWSHVYDCNTRKIIYKNSRAFGGCRTKLI